MCLNEQPNGEKLANRLLGILRSEKQCNVQIDQRASQLSARITSGEWVGISNQFDEDQMLPGLPFDRAKAAHKLIEFAFYLNIKDDVITGHAERHRLKWDLSGYLRDGTMVIAYRTAGTAGRGYGVYMMQNLDPRSDVYVGQVVGRECSTSSVARYPFILVKGTRDSQEVEWAKKQYASVLSQRGVTVNPAECK
jgi:hypothetical protein